MIGGRVISLVHAVRYHIVRRPFIPLQTRKKPAGLRNVVVYAAADGMYGGDIVAGMMLVRWISSTFLRMTLTWMQRTTKREIMKFLKSRTEYFIIFSIRSQG